MKEWREDDQFNSFNNWKGLLYSAHYERIVGGGVPMAPVEARIDLTLRCNLSCSWCNSAKYRKHGDELDKNAVFEILDYLAEWGVKAVVFAGGGEPTMHPDFCEIALHAKDQGFKIGLLSNGTADNIEVHKVVGKYFRWAGISVDAGTPEVYSKLKGKKSFSLVMFNLSAMVVHSENCNVGYKFLIAPGNQCDIIEACKRAKAIGVRDFIVRPMDTLHQGMANHDVSVHQLNASAIFNKFEECHKLATDDFHVYTVMHKFNPDFTHSKPFSQCYGAPLKVHIAPNGDIYFCDDQFYQPEYKLGNCLGKPHEFVNVWGGKRLKELLFGDTPKKCKTRCCIGDYNIQCERLFVDKDDPLCKDFP